jgi:hypothetical protein
MKMVAIQLFAVFIIYIDIMRNGIVTCASICVVAVILACIFSVIVVQYEERKKKKSNQTPTKQ